MDFMTSYENLASSHYHYIYYAPLNKFQAKDIMALLKNTTSIVFVRIFL